MIPLAVALLIVLVVVVLVVARWWTWRPVVHHRVLLQLDTGLTISGIVLSRRGPLLVLGDVTVMASGEHKTKADGSAVIERSRVVWMQVV